MEDTQKAEQEKEISLDEIYKEINEMKEDTARQYSHAILLASGSFGVALAFVGLNLLALTSSTDTLRGFASFTLSIGFAFVVVCAIKERRLLREWRLLRTRRLKK